MDSLTVGASCEQTVYCLQQTSASTPLQKGYIHTIQSLCFTTGQQISLFKSAHILGIWTPPI